MALAAEVTAGAAAAEEAGKQPAQQEQDAVLQSHRAIVHQACRRLNRLMLPFALLFSIIASLDRANLSFASVSMSQELGLSAVDYGLGSAIFFVSYSLFQIPSNVCFIYVGGPRMLGLIAVSWGIVAASMAAVNSRAAFLTVRFLLGIAEAGTVPGIWAYLSSMYPADHLTLPTTYYMAGITAAQALGAPLAAGLLTLNGAADMSGWRWLFVIEGAPAVLLGVAIWFFLPESVSKCKLLTQVQREHLQAAINCTIPPTSAAAAAASRADPSTASVPKTAVLATDDSSSRCSSSSSGSSSSNDTEVSISDSSNGQYEAATSADQQLASASSASLAASLAPHFYPPRKGAGGGGGALDGPSRPSRAELLADLAAAARCRVVWCSSFWRFLYLLTLNGLIFWVPLIVHSLLDVQPASDHAPHHESESVPNDTRIMLLAAVPYVAGVGTHLVNAMHSHRVHERRYHIAVPWLLGGILLLLLPVAWMHKADEVSYVLLVLASMGIMGCDGIDVSWIVSLMTSLTASQTTLALAMINMLANLGGFVGNYVIGALKQASGNYNGAVWMMGAIMVFAACLVALFPMSWASQCAECHVGKGVDGDAEAEAAGGCGCKGVAAVVGDRA